MSIKIISIYTLLEHNTLRHYIEILLNTIASITLHLLSNAQGLLYYNLVTLYEIGSNLATN